MQLGQSSPRLLTAYVFACLALAYLFIHSIRSEHGVLALQRTGPWRGRQPLRTTHARQFWSQEDTHNCQEKYNCIEWLHPAQDNGVDQDSTRYVSSQTHDKACTLGSAAIDKEHHNQLPQQEQPVTDYAAGPMWRYSPEALECGAHVYSSHEAQGLLRGLTLVFMGDSIIRKLYQALLSILYEPVEMARHADHVTTLPCALTLKFLWRPFPTNMTLEVQDWSPENAPDALIAGTLLWHVLHVTNASIFQTELAQYMAAAADMVDRYEQVHKGTIPLWWPSASQIVHDKLGAPEKRQAMTEEHMKEYADATQSVVLGGSTLTHHVLDLEEFSLGCGTNCTSDGIHYIDDVYAAAVNVVLNCLALMPLPLAKSIASC